MWKIEVMREHLKAGPQSLGLSVEEIDVTEFERNLVSYVKGLRKVPIQFILWVGVRSCKKKNKLDQY